MPELVRATGPGQLRHGCQGEATEQEDRNPAKLQLIQDQLVQDFLPDDWLKMRVG